MLLRRKILPRRFPDAIVTYFLLSAISIVSCFELFVVLPKFYTGGFWYFWHLFIGFYLLFNVCSNYAVLLLCDTSIRGRILPTSEDLNTGAKFCPVCKCIAPPRAWHCTICNICILKRDHHCIFTGCCIGHHNLRYFLMFVFYFFIGCAYISYYNVQIIYDFLDFEELWRGETVLKLMFPVVGFFVSLLFSFSLRLVYLYLVVAALMGGCMLSAMFLCYYLVHVARGVVTHEKDAKKYDLGVKRNFMEVFGERWYLVWVAPFFESKLPQDGVMWKVKMPQRA